MTYIVRHLPPTCMGHFEMQAVDADVCQLSEPKSAVSKRSNAVKIKLIKREALNSKQSACYLPRAFPPVSITIARLQSVLHHHLAGPKGLQVFAKSKRLNVWTEPVEHRVNDLIPNLFLTSAFIALAAQPSWPGAQRLRMLLPVDRDRVHAASVLLS